MRSAFVFLSVRVFLCLCASVCVCVHARVCACVCVGAPHYFMHATSDHFPSFRPSFPLLSSFLHRNASQHQRALSAWAVGAACVWRSVPQSRQGALSHHVHPADLRGLCQGACTWESACVCVCVCLVCICVSLSFMPSPPHPFNFLHFSSPPLSSHVCLLSLLCSQTASRIRSTTSRCDGGDQVMVVTWWWFDGGGHAVTAPAWTPPL